GIDQSRVIVTERSGYSVIDLGRVLDPNAADADGLSHGSKIRVSEFSAEIEKPGGFLLQLDEAERAIVEHHDLHRQAELRKAEKVSHQHREPAVARQRDHLPSRE